MRTSLALLVLASLARPAAADLCTSNLMIVLDRSCSMQDPPTPGATASKWSIAGAALQKLTTKYAGQLNFGLIMFPDQTGASCLQDGPIYVNVGPGRESLVVSTVMSTMPNGPCMTDILPAFDQVSKDPAFAGAAAGDSARSFVLFISDGMQTCGGSTAQIAQAISGLYNNGYDSYIVGFGGAVNPAALDMFALAGGVPRLGDGGARYYQADDAAALDQALDEIAGAVLSMTEFGGCPGVPCPDGRCFGAGQTCVAGSCVAPSLTDGGGGTGGAGGHGSGKGGCACRVDGDSSIAGALALIAVVAFGLRRARRRG
jgi:MYXO-CTERM domain-containing protein